MMDSANWNEIVAAFSGKHILQTWEWALVKQKYGWEPEYKVWKDENGQIQAAALVLQRTVSLLGPLGKVRILYVPRGPMLLDWSNTSLRQRIIDALQSLAAQRRAIFVKIDPELITGRGVPGGADDQVDPVGKEALGELIKRGWIFSNDQIQFRNTIWLDLSGTQDELLACMKQKTRYNIRLAGRKGVKIREGSIDDLSFLYKMYAETSARDGFVIRSEEYYLTVWQSFMEKGMAVPLIAEVEGEPVAALMLFIFAGKAWYLHGMSTKSHRNKMPTYLLQWEAMLHAKAAGCEIYDLWGAPDEFNETDSMWGVYRFKRGLGGKVIRTSGAWDYPNRPFLYWLYTRILPKILDVMRERGKKKTLKEVNQ